MRRHVFATLVLHRHTYIHTSHHITFESKQTNTQSTQKKHSRVFCRRHCLHCTSLYFPIKYKSIFLWFSPSFSVLMFLYVYEKKKPSKIDVFVLIKIINFLSLLWSIDLLDYIKRLSRHIDQSPLRFNETCAQLRGSKVHFMLFTFFSFLYCLSFFFSLFYFFLNLILSS